MESYNSPLDFKSPVTFMGGHILRTFKPVTFIGGHILRAFKLVTFIGGHILRAFKPATFIGGHILRAFKPITFTGGHIQASIPTVTFTGGLILGAFKPQSPLSHSRVATFLGLSSLNHHCHIHGWRYSQCSQASVATATIREGHMLRNLKP